MEAAVAENNLLLLSNKADTLGTIIGRPWPWDDRGHLMSMAGDWAWNIKIGPFRIDWLIW